MSRPRLVLSSWSQNHNVNATGRRRMVTTIMTTKATAVLSILFLLSQIMVTFVGAFVSAHKTKGTITIGSPCGKAPFQLQNLRYPAGRPSGIVAPVLFVTILPDASVRSPASSLSPSPTEQSVPTFVIDRIGGGGGGDTSSSSVMTLTDKIARQISDLCIDVFFKEELMDGNGWVSPWQELQIEYLKNLQAGDLRLRRRRYPKKNAMFLAFEVKPAIGSLSGMTQPLLLPDQLKDAFNFPPINDDDDYGDINYVRGDLLGFVEVTQRQYGLGTAGGWKGGKANSDTPFRPVLTNLAVSPKARKFGIGSSLLDACESHVQNQWKLNDIVLEVEDYNEKAVQFYTKRGFEVIFSDPASRRYDVSGFWIKKVRCRREILRKLLSGGPSDSTNVMNVDIFRKIRDGLGL